MKYSFLEYVAKDLLEKFGTNLSHIAVVFPNKRASLFLNKHLAQLSDRPLWSPSYLTISDLFRQHSTLTVGDPIKLICDLHKSFITCTGREDTLDVFYAWGELLLADYDDIDKNLADADKVFANLKNIHELDDISYLSEHQKQILQKFFSNFDENHHTELKRRFIELWSHLSDIYHHFNEKLSLQGLAYEGALYRDVVSDKNLSFEFDQYIFVGFNVLQQVEQELFRQLKSMGKAKFYWDFDDYYMSDEKQEASHFIRQYLDVFPNELDCHNANIYQQFKQPKQITYLSAPTETIQARYISEWLQHHDRMEAGIKTAIVMCDESILQTVIHCIPPEVSKVNITTGYPLAQSPVASLIHQLLKLQLSSYAHNGKYRLTEVKRMLSHPYIKYLSENAPELIVNLEENKHYFPTREELSVDAGLTLVFKELVDDSTNLYLTEWILEILQLIGKNGRDSEDAFFQESVFRMYTLMNRLHELIHSEDLRIQLTTYEKLILQLIQNTSIPFHGEPAEGIQIMGVLETRNLDFDHILILSCNEGNMPKGVNDASFIPYSIREAYGLTTMKHKVAIYAYYFHRLLQRASDITLTYNNSTEGSHKSEMSRFMLQMLVESGHPIQKIAMLSGQEIKHHEAHPIEKKEMVMEVLYNMNQISPTAINRYMRCQLQFYYNTIAKLYEPEPDNDIDNRMFGNIFHRSAELIYTSLQQESEWIEPTQLNKLRTKSQLLERFVDQAFYEEIYKSKDKVRPIEYNGLQLINRKVIIDYLKRLLKIDEALAPFRILSLEERVNTTISFETAQELKTITVGGIIDRLDEVTDPDGTHRIRVVDYKTGRPATSVPTDVKDIFSDDNLTEKHKDYYLQTFLYANIVRQHQEFNPHGLPVSPALLFIQQNPGDDFDPTLLLSKEKVSNIGTYSSAFSKHLQQVLTDMYDSSHPFTPTQDNKRCTYCPYKRICGRN